MLFTLKANRVTVLAPSLQTTETSHTNQSVKLEPKDYTVACTAPVEAEVSAAQHWLEERDRGLIPVGHDNDYVLRSSLTNGYNIIIATLSADWECGTGRSC